MKTTHFARSFVLSIILAIALMYSYEGLQFLEILILNHTLFQAYPTISDYLQKNLYQLDCILIIPMLIIYGILVNRFVLSKDDAKPLNPTLRNFKIIGLRKYCVPLKYDIAVCFIIGCGLNGLSSLWFVFADKYLMQFTFWSSSMDSFSDAYPEMTSGNAVFDILSVIILGPIVEELLFRGLIYNALKYVRDGWFPILASGILFGLFHVEPVQVVYTSVIGILLGIIYYGTKRLDIVILVHMFNNLVSTFAPEINSEPAATITSIFIYAMIIPMIIIFIIYTIVGVHAKRIKQQ